MLNKLHMFEYLRIHSQRDEHSKFAHVPNYTPTILKKLQEDRGHYHHHHVLRLERESTDGSTTNGHTNNSRSIFVPENSTKKRGIFRTMESIWACTADAAPNHKSEANMDGLIIMDNESQTVLENSFKNKQSLCNLPDESIAGGCTVEMSYDNEKSACSCTSATSPTAKQSSVRHLVYGTDIQRMNTPVWWYEKEGATGKKELARFDWKNQIRLEAFADDESTLSLTDTSFPEPFTVALNPYKERQINEWQGFIYLDTVPRLDDTDDEEDDYHDLSIQGKDSFPNFNTFTNEGEQETEEEAYRNAHIKR